MPWRRHRSFVLVPASASSGTAMICSSVNRSPFMVHSSLGRTLTPFGTNGGCQVKHAQSITAWLTALRGRSTHLAAPF